MGKGCSASGPLSWMRSEERVPGSPIGACVLPSWGSGRDGEVGCSEGRGRAAGPTAVSQGHYFRIFFLFPPSPLPAWRRRLVD